MQFGSWTVPLLPVAAVVGAGVLLLLVLGGVWRARRHPAPAPLPVARPAVPVAEQPCAEDWTGEAAGGPADPPPPARPRTVADIVAARGADTGPIPGLPAPGTSGTGSAAAPRPSRTGRHAADDQGAEVLSAPADERPAPTTVARTGPGDVASASEPAGHAGDAPAPGAAAAGTARVTDDDSGGTGSDRSTAGPPPARPVARLRIAEEETTGSGAADRPGPHDPAPAADDPVAPGTDDPVAPGTDTAATAAGEDPPTPLPPWSTERTVPAARDLPTGGRPAGDPAPARGPEPVSRAVQQALAARAVQRARMRRDGADPDDDAVPAGEQQELPLAVVPSRPVAPPAGGDPRDRLLSVLVSDPARAVDATIRLDDSRDRIEELGDVLRRRRADLAGAVGHLRDCGLDPAQIGRLSGMPVDDVRAILDGEDAR